MKKTIVRIVGIGLFHATLYLYIVPFLIYPKFGSNGFKFTIIVAIMISIAIIGTILFEKKK